MYKNLLTVNDVNSVYIYILSVCDKIMNNFGLTVGGDLSETGGKTVYKYYQNHRCK